VDFCETVDRADALFHRAKMGGGDGVAFIDYHDVCVRDLEVCCGFLSAMAATSFLREWRLLIQAQEYVLRVDQADDSVEVDTAPQPLVDPEQRSQVPGVSQPGCFEDYVVEGSAAVHERLDGVDTRVFDAAAETAVAQFEPFRCGGVVLGDRQGFLNVGC